MRSPRRLTLLVPLVVTALGCETGGVGATTPRDALSDDGRPDAQVDDARPGDAQPPGPDAAEIPDGPAPTPDAAEFHDGPATPPDAAEFHDGPATPADAAEVHDGPSTPPDAALPACPPPSDPWTRKLPLVGGALTFNELLPTPAVGPNDPVGAFIELYNQQAIDLDVSGWSLGGDVAFTFPEGTFVAGGGTIVVAANPAALAAAAPGALVVGPLAEALPNDFEVTLRSNTRRLMDSVEVGRTPLWALAGGGHGAIGLQTRSRSRQPRRRELDAVRRGRRHPRCAELRPRRSARRRRVDRSGRRVARRGRPRSRRSGALGRARVR
jgi:hypothetical protein